VPPAGDGGDRGGREREAGDGTRGGSRRRRAPDDRPQLRDEGDRSEGRRAVRERRVDRVTPNDGLLGRPLHRLEKIGMLAPDNGARSRSSRATMSRPVSSAESPAFSCGAAARSISVSTAPGEMHTALMPRSRPSTASISVSPTTPYFETLYARRPGNFSVA